MVDRPGLPGNAIESTTVATVAANGGLWTLGFKTCYLQGEFLSNLCKNTD